LYSAIKSEDTVRWWRQVKTVWKDGSWGIVWRCPQYGRI